MNGWGRYIDDLAAASAALLNEGRSGPQPLVQPVTALVARDVVLTELRQLVGAVSQSPRFAEVRELTLFDIVHRPGQSLHQALSELPRAVPFGAAMSDEYVVFVEATRPIKTDVVPGGISPYPDTDLFLLSLGTGKIYNLHDVPAQQGFPSLSGRQLVWQDATFGGDDVFTAAIPGGL